MGKYPSLENKVVLGPRGSKSLENTLAGSAMTKIPGNTRWGEKPKSLEHDAEFGVVAASFNSTFALDVGAGVAPCKLAERRNLHI